MSVTTPETGKANFPSEVEETASAASRILVVEDDLHTRTILHKRLKKNGYEVEIAENGLEGWEKVESFRPDIIISDWMMPVMDGHELCTKVKGNEKTRSTFFILLTAKDAREDKVGALDAGADEYLVKPCDPQELLARVRAAERVVGLQQTLESKNAELEGAMSRINQELKITSEIQRLLLPQELLKVPGYEFACYYRPSTECSGDYYDLLDLGDGRFGAIMADVSGHGTPAMVAMALVRSLFHLYAPEAESPADLLTLINRLLFHHLPTSQFVTAFYSVWDAKSGSFQYSSAGQNPPLVINRTSGEAFYLKNCEGFPLKLVDPEIEYHNHEHHLEPGGSLLLYTDGIPEGCNAKNEMFESSRLAEAALSGDDASPEGVLKTVLKLLMQFLNGTPLLDDVTMLMVDRVE